MKHMMETVSDGPLFQQRILADLAPSYLLAHSGILEGDSFESLRAILLSLSNALSNLLMPVCEYPDLIAPYLPGHSPGHELVHKIAMASERLCELNQYLVRLCHGHEGTPAHVDLALLAHEVLVDLFQHQAGLDSASVELEIDDQPSVLTGLYDALYHMVRDLCVNAFQSMGPDGALSVRVGSLAIPADGLLHRLGVLPASYLVLQIKDNGPGIAPACRHTLFDPFVSTTPGEGHGLGLCSVYRTVRHLHGTILYNPEGGSGSNFLLFFFFFTP